MSTNFLQVAMPYYSILIRNLVGRSIKTECPRLGIFAFSTIGILVNNNNWLIVVQAYGDVQLHDFIVKHYGVI